MPGTPARLTVAERPAATKPSQDRTVLLPDAAAVLDGASAPETTEERDGGWYAGVLAAELAERLPDRSLDLRTVLADSIAAVTSAYRLRAGSAPSSTVTLLRWDESRVDGLVLGDSPLVVFPGPEVLVDDRLAAIAPRQRVAYHDRLKNGGGYDEGHRTLLRALVAEQRRHRNSPGGYWIAEAAPAAAGHALTRSWARADVHTALLASDGVSRGIGRAVPDWTAALALVDAHGPDALLDAVRVPEQADPDGRGWPRAKPYDDQALVVVGLSPAPSTP